MIDRISSTRIGLALSLSLVTTGSAAFAQDAGPNPAMDAAISASTPDAAAVATAVTDPDASADSAANEANRPTVTSVRVVLIDTAPIGVDPAAGAFVNAQLAEALRSFGYGTVPSEELYTAARQMGLAFPVPEAGMVALNLVLHSTIALQCELRARAGFYFATLRIRQADESRERSLSVVANQWTLGDRLREALLRLLRGADGSTLTESSPTLGTPNTPVIIPSNGSTSGAGYSWSNLTPPTRPPIWVHPFPVDIAAGLSVAYNPGQSPFTGFLAQARVSWFPIDRFGLSATFAYVNLPGRTRRISNFLPTVGVETGVDLVPQIGLFVPMRLEFGFLPYNGPVLRISAGLSIKLNNTMRLQLDLVQPTIWWINDVPVATMDLGAQFVVSFGRDRSRPDEPAATTPASTPDGTPRRRRRRRRATPAVQGPDTGPTPMSMSTSGALSRNEPDTPGAQSGTNTTGATTVAV